MAIANVIQTAIEVATCGIGALITRVVLPVIAAAIIHYAIPEIVKAWTGLNIIPGLINYSELVNVTVGGIPRLIMFLLSRIFGALMLIWFIKKVTEIVPDHSDEIKRKINEGASITEIIMDVARFKMIEMLGKLNPELATRTNDFFNSLESSKDSFNKERIKNVLIKGLHNPGKFCEFVSENGDKDVLEHINAIVTHINEHKKKEAMSIITNEVGGFLILAFITSLFVCGLTILAAAMTPKNPENFVKGAPNCGIALATLLPLGILLGYGLRTDLENIKRRLEELHAKDLEEFVQSIFEEFLAFNELLLVSFVLIDYWMEYGFSSSLAKFFVFSHIIYMLYLIACIVKAFEASEDDRQKMISLLLGVFLIMLYAHVFGLSVVAAFEEYYKPLKSVIRKSHMSLLRKICDFLTAFCALGVVTFGVSNNEKYVERCGFLMSVFAIAGGITDAWEDEKLSPFDLATAFYTGISLGYHYIVIQDIVKSLIIQKLFK